MTDSRRTVKAHLNRDNVVIYQLLQGGKKTAHLFGYGRQHAVWLSIKERGKLIEITSEPAASVKGKIAGWSK